MQPSDPAAIEARLAVVDERIAAIDARLAELRQRLLAIDRTLSVPAQLVQGTAVPALLGPWLTPAGAPSQPRPWVPSAPTATSLT